MNQKKNSHTLIMLLTVLLMDERISVCFDNNFSTVLQFAVPVKTIIIEMLRTLSDTAFQET